MTLFRFLLAGAVAMAAAGVAEDATAQGQPQFITIGTGGITGVYYPAGGAICRLINQSRKEHGIRCTVESTGGSVFNVNAIASGDITLGMTQGDVQYFALKGEGPFKERGPNTDLRALFSLHPESMTVVARKDVGIKAWGDIRGKRLNVGDPGSGLRVMTEDLIRASSFKVADLKLATDLKPAEMAGALCDNKIDAFTYVVGHPSAAIKEATTTCGAVVIPVSDTETAKVIKGAPYYAAATIPAKMYGDHPDIKTYGVRATVVASSKMSEAAAYTVVKAVFDNLEELKKLHPALANLTAQEMVSGNTMPYHEGAQRYFREKGLIK